MFTLLRILGNTLAFVLYAGGFLVLMMIVLFLLTPWGWVLIPAAIALRMGVARQARRRRGDLVAVYVEQAVRMNLPLAEAMTAAATSETGPLRQTLRRLAGELIDGVPTGEAIDRAAKELPCSQRSVLVTGERAGRFAAALQRVARLRRIDAETDAAALGTVWGYPLAMTCIVGVVLTGIVVLILPKFEEIFADFDVAMPATTLSVMRAGQWLSGRLTEGQLVPGLFWMVLLILLVVAMAILLRAGALGSGLARLAWWTPVVGRLERSRSWSDACFVVGQSLEAGVPVDEAIGEAARLRVNPVARGRLHAWARRLREGVPLDEAAERAGMPGLIAGTLATAQASDNLPAALGFLARHYEMQASWTAALVRGATVPAMVLFFAGIVAWITVGMILPLATLIWSLIPAAEGVTL